MRADTAALAEQAARRAAARRLLHSWHCKSLIRLCPPDGAHAHQWDDDALTLVTATTVEGFLTALHDAMCLMQLTGDCIDPSAHIASMRQFGYAWRALADLTHVEVPRCARHRVGVTPCQAQRPCLSHDQGKQLGCGRAGPL